MRIVYPKKIAIGVDIGGTKIKAGLVDINGQIIGIPESIRTLAHEPGEMIIEQLTLLIRRMIQQADGAELIGIGIGSLLMGFMQESIGLTTGVALTAIFYVVGAVVYQAYVDGYYRRLRAQ